MIRLMGALFLLSAPIPIIQIMRTDLLFMIMKGYELLETNGILLSAAISGTAVSVN